VTDHEIEEEETAVLELGQAEEFEETAFDEDEGPELADGGIVRRILAEFLGAFFLALVIATASGPTAPVLVGLTAAVLFFLFGPISGGHCNPVVTAALGLLGRIRAELAWVYVFVQFAAGFAAFALVWALRPPLDDAARGALRANIDTLVGAVGGQVPWFPAHWPLLILLSLLLVAAVLAARSAFGQGPQAAAWIGVAVGATFWAGNAIYPAASVPAVVFNGYASAFRALPVLVFFPLIGAYVGALVYREIVVAHPVEADEDDMDEADVLDEADAADGAEWGDVDAEHGQDERETADEDEDSQPRESS
jgi:aquaporin Z